MRARHLAEMAVALCTGLGLATGASAQCATYTISNPGPAVFIPGNNDIGNHGNDSVTTIALPFTFRLYNTPYSSARVTSDGLVQFTTSSIASTSVCLPTTAVGGPAIFVLWDDHTTASATSGQGIFTATIGTAPHRTFVIEWRVNMGFSTGIAHNFELILTEGSNAFDMVYQTIGPSAATDSTVGVQAGGTAGSINTQLACNTAIVSGTSVRFDCSTNSGACCNTFTGACSLGPPSICTGSGQSYRGDGTVCSTASCPVGGSCCIGRCCVVLNQASCGGLGSWISGGTCAASSCTATVSNDACASAINIAVGEEVVASNCGATVAADEPGPLCGAGRASVWYALTPAVSGYFDVTTCGSSFDVLVSVNTSPDCHAWSILNCNDDSCNGGEPGVVPGVPGHVNAAVISGAQLSAGVRYLIRVAGFDGATGVFRLVVLPNLAAGACCNTFTAACNASLTGPGGCDQASIFVGGSCNPNPCSQPAGACCSNAGTCSIRFGPDCTADGGLFKGFGSACADPGNGGCPAIVGACCNINIGNCVLVVAGGCSNFETLYLGDGSACVPNFCPLPTGACCCGSNCRLSRPADCNSSGQTFIGDGTSCLPFSFIAPCCRGDYNKNGAPVSVQDIFDFLSGYFGNDTCADTNDSGEVSVQDIFDFLAAYFSGC